MKEEIKEGKDHHEEVISTPLQKIDLSFDEEALKKAITQCLQFKGEENTDQVKLPKRVSSSFFKNITANDITVIRHQGGAKNTMHRDNSLNDQLSSICVSPRG